MSSNDNGDINLGLTPRLASAMTGSLLTSFLVTPMDVVRVRLQQQELLPDCSCDINKLSTLNMKSGVKALRVESFSHNSSIFWESLCFKDLSCKNAVTRYDNTWEALLNISRKEGLTTLWRGLSLTLLMAIPANVIYYTGYEYVRDISPLERISPNLNPVICGATARVLAASSIAPFELLKTRLQSIPSPTRTAKTSKIIRDLLKETRKDLNREGYKSLFRGLEITLWRDVPFSAIYWGTYEFCKKKLWSTENDKHEFSNTNNNQFFKTFSRSFISGCISGSMAAVFTHPFDVGKTRLQISMLNSDNSNKMIQRQKNGSKQSMFIFLRNIYRTEGMNALFTGLLPRLLKIAPSCAIMISTYEVSKRIFSINT